MVDILDTFSIRYVVSRPKLSYCTMSNHDSMYLQAI